MTTYCRGVDVSSWDGMAVPDGLDFVWIKATQGTTYVNPKMKEQADSARAKGYIVGFYHFLEPGNVAGQMAHFAAEALSLPSDPLGIDWERLPDGRFATCAEKDEALAKLHELRPTHRRALYCNLDFWHNQDTTSQCGDGLWIADPDMPPGSPRVKHPWLFHQYSSSPMDMDVAAFQTRLDLKHWAEGGTVAVSVPGPPPVAPPPPPVPAPSPTPVVEEEATGDESVACDSATVFCHSPNCTCPACPMGVTDAPAQVAVYKVTVFADGTLKVDRQ